MLTESCVHLLTNICNHWPYYQFLQKIIYTIHYTTYLYNFVYHFDLKIMKECCFIQCVAVQVLTSVLLFNDM